MVELQERGHVSLGPAACTLVANRNHASANTCANGALKLRIRLPLIAVPDCQFQSQRPTFAGALGQTSLVEGELQ